MYIIQMFYFQNKFAQELDTERVECDDNLIQTVMISYGILSFGREITLKNKGIRFHKDFERSYTVINRVMLNNVTIEKYKTPRYIQTKKNGIVIIKLTYVAPIIGLEESID